MNLVLSNDIRSIVDIVAIENKETKATLPFKLTACRDETCNNIYNTLKKECINPIRKSKNKNMSLLIKAKDGHKFYNYEEGCYDYSIGVHVPVVLNASEIGWETIYAPTSLSNENERIIQRVLWNSRNIRSTTRCQVFDAIHEKYNETYEFVSDEYNPRDDKYYGAWVSIVDPNEIINVTIQPVRNGLSPINICVSRIEEKENFKINILGY